MAGGSAANGNNVCGVFWMMWKNPTTNVYFYSSNTVSVGTNLYTGGNTANFQQGTSNYNPGVNT